MSKMKLSYADQNAAIIYMLSGVSMAAVARKYNVSPSTIASIRTRYPERFSMFKEVDGIVELSDKSMTLDINGTFCANKIIVTGNPSDGIIMCTSIYDNSIIDGDVSCDAPLIVKADLVDWPFFKDEIGLMKTVKCGVLIYRTANDDNTEGASHAPDDKYSGISGSRFCRTAAATEVPKTPELIWNASNRFISITRGREVFNASSEHPDFNKALQMLVSGDVNGALELINKEQAVKRFTQGNIVIEKGRLFYKNVEIKSGLVNRIIDAMNKGKDFKFFLPFLENLMLNPSKQSVDRLFDFLQANDISITKTGYIIAWKKIGYNYRDLFSNTMDNSVGKIVEMPRNQVNDDDQATCSTGLHACAKSYLCHFGSGSGYRVVKVKIHPRDVVSIPTDYKNAKLRCCRYEVVEEVKA